ncbi:hypothetical protein [Streptomyces sp. NPDC004330]|uniref:hypothetical protein n=1 Tax=Streptomyces sp. NPDC004330 TaxID=3364700 RepID=UPI003685D49B
MMEDTTYFLLTFDRRRQKLVSKEAFSSEEQASAAYAALEARNRNAKDDYEVVLVGADSEATLHHTHGHYFGRTSSSRFLKPVLAG